jgi:hypothetical protein
MGRTVKRMSFGLGWPHCLGPPRPWKPVRSPSDVRPARPDGCASLRTVCWQLYRRLATSESCPKCQLRQDDPRWQWAHFGAAAARWVPDSLMRVHPDHHCAHPVLPLTAADRAATRSMRPWAPGPHGRLLERRPLAVYGGGRAGGALVGCGFFGRRSPYFWSADGPLLPGFSRAPSTR